MSMQDPISDMLTNIRNAQLSKKLNISIFYSKIKESILNILFNEGYICNYRFYYFNKIKKILINLKYFLNNPVISKIKRISKPGLRIYKNYKNLPSIISGLGIFIISTSLGILSDKNARKFKVGGEIICYVY